MPKFFSSRKKSLVPPKRPALEIISSPTSTMFMTAAEIAAIPEENATAPAPRSSLEIRRSKVAVVGFEIRL